MVCTALISGLKTVSPYRVIWKVYQREFLARQEWLDQHVTCSPTASTHASCTLERSSLLILTMPVTSCPGVKILLCFAGTAPSRIYPSKWMDAIERLIACIVSQVAGVRCLSVRPFAMRQPYGEEVLQYLATRMAHSVRKHRLCQHDRRLGS